MKRFSNKFKALAVIIFAVLAVTPLCACRTGNDLYDFVSSENEEGLYDEIIKDYLKSGNTYGLLPALIPDTWKDEPDKDRVDYSELTALLNKERSKDGRYSS